MWPLRKGDFCATAETTSISNFQYQNQTKGAGQKEAGVWAWERGQVSLDTNLKSIQMHCKVIKWLNYRGRTGGWGTVDEKEKDTFIPFPPKTEFEILADQSDPPFNVICLTEMQMWGCCEFHDCGYKCFLQSHTLWTWEAGSHPCHLYPSSLNLFPWLPRLVAASAPQLLRCHPVPSSLCPRNNFQLVINKERGEASWTGVSGMTLSRAKSAFKLAFFIRTVSNSATFTDGVSQTVLGSQRITKRITWGL